VKTSTPLQARNIIRSAKRQGITLTRWPGSNCTTKVCAAAVIGSEIEGNAIYAPDRIASLLNVPEDNIVALSYGFEGYRVVPNHLKKNRYYKVGQRVAQLAGLPLYDS
jgi:hypothetical protein